MSFASLNDWVDSDWLSLFSSFISWKRNTSNDSNKTIPQFHYRYSCSLGFPVCIALEWCWTFIVTVIFIALVRTGLKSPQFFSTSTTTCQSVYSFTQHMWNNSACYLQKVTVPLKLQGTLQTIESEVRLSQCHRFRLMDRRQWVIPTWSEGLWPRGGRRPYLGDIHIEQAYGWKYQHSSYKTRLPGCLSIIMTHLFPPDKGHPTPDSCNVSSQSLTLALKRVTP